MSNQTIAPVATADPWMIAANGVFYLTFTLANRISIWESPMMEDFHNPRKQIIWQPTKGSQWSTDIWAPELHNLNGVWYIYATASHPGAGNPAHRTIVLRSRNHDPMDASGWEFLGPMKGMPELFSIDATVFSPNGQDLYLCWSGWPPDRKQDTEQNLYIKQMISPEEVVPEDVMPAVCIARPEYEWERFQKGSRGINEGPTWLNLPGGAFTGIVYSGHASFTSEYKLGLLRLVRPDADPLDPKSWIKRPTPLLMNDKSMAGPYAPGHASFLQSPVPGDPRVFCIYHATEHWGEGFKNRKARVLAFGPGAFTHDARPLCCSNAPDNPIWGGKAVGGIPHDTRPQFEHQTPQEQQHHQGSHEHHQSDGKASDSVKKLFGKFKKYI